jgi:hypothetical protein
MGGRAHRRAPLSVQEKFIKGRAYVLGDLSK